MKKIIVLFCLLTFSVTGFAQGLGLPDNSAVKPARASKTNTSYAAIVTYRSHSENL